MTQRIPARSARRGRPAHLAPAAGAGGNRGSRSPQGFRARRTAVLIGAAVLLLAGALPAPADGGRWAGVSVARAEEEAKKPEKSVDSADVFHGDARNWSKPAEVDADAVFAEIAEYKQIVEKKLGASDPEYGVLMSKARKRFRKALCDAAKDGDYDLVAKVGSVKGVENVPVITQAVIGKL